MTAIVNFLRSEHGDSMLTNFSVTCPSVISAIEVAAEVLAKNMGLPESIYYQDKKGDNVLIWKRIYEVSRGKMLSDLSLDSQLIELCNKYGTRCPLLDKNRKVIPFKGYPDSMNGPAGPCPWWGGA